MAAKKRGSQFSGAARIITENVITALTSGHSTDESDVDVVFSPLGSDLEQDVVEQADQQAEYEDFDDEFDLEQLMFNSRPEKFVNFSRTLMAEHDDRASRQSVSYPSDLKGLIQRNSSSGEVELPINEDFWKDVNTSAGEETVFEERTISHAQVPQTSATLRLADPIDSATIGDFIKNDVPSGLDTALEAEAKFIYPIKKVSYRDAAGKLVVDPKVAQVEQALQQNLAVSHKRVLKSKKRRSKFKKIYRSGSGWGEMVSTGIGIGEFMLL